MSSGTENPWNHDPARAAGVTSNFDVAGAHCRVASSVRLAHTRQLVVTVTQMSPDSLGIEDAASVMGCPRPSCPGVIRKVIACTGPNEGLFYRKVSNFLSIYHTTLL
jgi:hypothetical protein